ncbi:hypothetical protein GE107_02830 [Cohnella sp. CFH 77786]|uniref:hypothetical protein n=1 Tax=Cohnella sp. CFH 77786 TaxID=2662265 RepID=UPI001C60ADBF|nr:hypothetical protein [Cohnella sp. CFH 77786]MBW5445000.1 hypothetical protein [Cohnella sp. CFH 77786]
MMTKFNDAFEAFLTLQKQEATGMRREMLDRDLTGTKKLCEALWQVFGSFDDLILEYEVVSETGIKIYIDVYHRVLRIAFEAEGYAVHADKITRERHSFEKMRERTFTKYDFKHMPFSWDELDKKPEACKRSVFELLGRFGDPGGGGWMELPVYEREIIRSAAVHPGPFSFSDACRWLQSGPRPVRKALSSLVDKHLLVMEGGGSKRFHKFRLSMEAVRKL